jgi:hypothetical protein
MRVIRLLVVAVLVAAGFVHAPAATAAKSFTSTLSGANELPSGSGDTDGTGTASFTLKKKKRTLCWTIAFQNIDAPNAGHIHTGGANAEGGIYILLFSGALDSGASDCVKVSKSQAKDLLDDTANRFYVNLHNGAFPDGAIRGQLQQS